ncbi:S-layer homology domain-containing protein [uncultured Flavonifractor sp.]|uniref:S-layer homology domain-containing protein n=1 Tax=uncultured Flavonifractor sp. TaxID=1193534 RepID=UPI00174B7E22|nr:S-layer homology domain-containing protein [uncultured Flavonifractor sp.]
MKKIPAALLSLALTASLTTPLASAAQGNTAGSLPELDGHWSQAAFERWHAHGIVEGDSRGMRPDANMTVAEFAAILCRAMGYTETVENPYADLKGDEWYAPYILRLTAAGILEGDGANCNAEEPMNRERATVLFARAMGIRPSENPDLSNFVDGDEAADWSVGYIDAMADAGIVQGIGGSRLALGASITRGSVVTLLDNAVAEYADQDGASVTGDVDGIVLVAADSVTVDAADVDGGVIVAPKAGEARLTVKDSTVTGELWVNTKGAAVSLEGASQVTELTVDRADGTVTVGADASVSALNARAAVKVDNQGSISKASVHADNVVLDGRQPDAVEVAEGVIPPTDSDGDAVTGGVEKVSGVVGVRPVDQDSPETQLPAVTAKAVKRAGEDFVRVALSTDEVVPVHQSEGAGKGAWVGVAFQAPEGYEGDTFHYAFGTEESDEAGQSTSVTENPAIGEGKYAVFFINAAALTPKTHITLQWDGREAVRYEVDLSGVRVDIPELTGVTVSTHQLPAGVSSTAEGLSFDGSTALVENGGSGSLTQSQVAAMGGGGEYTVYYSVPQALGEGTLQFDKIARSVNGGKWNTWAMPSSTGADAGSGWWTKDGDNYYFKWGAVFAQQAEDAYQMKDGGVFDYTIAFLSSDGSQDNVAATYTFRIDLSGYTITADE